MTQFARSLILESLYPSPKTTRSFLLSSILYLGSQLVFYAEKVGIQSSLFAILRQFAWKRIVIFLFIISLLFRAESNLEISTVTQITLGPTNVFVDRQFGIPLFSPSNILLPFLILFLIKQYSPKRTSFVVWNFEVLLLIFLLVVGLSILTSFNMQASIIWLLKFLFGFTLYYIFSRLQLGKREIRIILFAFLTAVLLNILLAILQWIKGGLVGLPFENIRTTLPAEIISSFRGTGHFRVVGFLSHPDRLAAFLAFALPIVTVLLFQKSTLVKSVSLIALVGSFVVPFLSLSRWGVVNILFSFIFTFILIFLFKLFSRHAFLLLKISVLSAFTVVILVVSNQIVLNRFTQFSPAQDRSFEARMELVRQAIFTIKENPLTGIGGGNFPLFMLNYDATESGLSLRFPAPVHNFYLLLISEVGFVGFAIFIASMLSLVKFFLVKIKTLPHEMRLIVVGLSVSCISFLFNGLWATSLLENRSGFLFWVVLGVLVNILSQGKNVSRVI